MSSPYFYTQLEQFLASNGLCMEKLDRYLTVQADGKILAGAGLYKDIIKCVAVAQEARSEGLVAPLVSRLIADASASGIHNLKVFTKPENQAIFESLGFRLLAEAPKAVLMENGKGLERYCEYLKGFRRPGRSGVIVMNSNPLTLGHKYLIDKASEQVDNLYIIPVKEDLSLFPYSERLEMIRLASEKGTEVCSASAKNYADATAEHTSIPNSSSVTVLEGSDYIISAATFPTYFLKEKSDAAETQMLLDLDLYSRWIAPALDASVRFVGSEPLDALTAQYNTLIPNAVIIPRLEMASAGPAASENYFFGRCQKNQFSEAIANLTHADAISASKVRKALEEGSFREAASMCPESTWPYLLGQLAERALRLELDTPMKPGLVCPDSCGAHKDMDYALMLKGISAIRPFFPKMAKAKSADELRQLGIDAEKAMMAATCGVNTHRGAIFCLGLALNAAGREMESPAAEELMQKRLVEIAQAVFCKQLTDNQFHSTFMGARRIAATGYKELFEDWLPYYRFMRGKEVFSSAKNNADAPEKTSSPLQTADAPEKYRQATLLRIMSTLDDTCVVKRVGPERAEAVKGEAASLLENWSEEKLKDLCARYAREGISPGGAADMLALTIFIDSIIL